jgi:uncharacterized coiled-coil DUF342 family protein
MSGRDAFVNAMKARIDEWNADIDKIEAKAKQAAASAQSEYHEMLTELRKRRDEAVVKMKELQATNEEAWGDMRGGFEKAWTDLAGAFQSAMQRYRR